VQCKTACVAQIHSTCTQCEHRRPRSHDPRAARSTRGAQLHLTNSRIVAATSLCSTSAWRSTNVRNPAEQTATRPLTRSDHSPPPHGPRRGEIQRFRPPPSASLPALTPLTTRRDVDQPAQILPLDAPNCLVDICIRSRGAGRNWLAWVEVRCKP
jgi:hypothetical protein